MNTPRRSGPPLRSSPQRRGDPDISGTAPGAHRRTGGDRPAPTPRPERVRVTGPRTGRPRRRSVAAEIDAQTAVGEIYMRSLVHSQLRLALRTLAVLSVSVGGLPLLFLLWPALRHGHLLGLPLPWLLLGVAVYPVLIGLAWTYVRRAERNEDAFRDLLDPHPGEAP